MTKTEIEDEVGKKWFLADDNTLAAKLIYIAGIQGFDSYLGNADQEDKNDVIHLREMPKGLIIRLAKIFSANEVGISYKKIDSIILITFARYSVLKIINQTSEIYFGIDNKDILEVKEFINSIKIVKFMESTISEIPSGIKNKLENYLYKNTDLLPINTEKVKATKTKRFLNYFVDIIIISFISFLFGFNLNGQNLTVVIVFLSYYLLMEGVFSTTIGKLLTNTKVVDIDGTSVVEVFVRTMCRIIPFEPLSFLFGKNGWHDSISKTTVIDKGMRKKLLPTLYKRNAG